MKKVWEGEYYPYGEEFRVTTEVVENKKRLIGKEKDEETGLTYFGARYMDETIGRFISPDPVKIVDASTSKTNEIMLSEPQRINRYTYGLNNPNRYIDPDGKTPRTPRTGPNGQPVTRQTQNSDLSARTAIKIQQNSNPNYRYSSIGNQNGGYMSQRDVQNINSSGSANREILRYQKYWEGLQGRAPERSSPYNILIRYDRDGNVRGATTYDVLGNRAMQYEFGRNVRHGEGSHTYGNSGQNRGFGKGPRKKHKSFD